MEIENVEMALNFWIFLTHLKAWAILEKASE